MPRLLKTLTVAGIAYGLWVWIKSLLDEPPHPIAQEAATTATPKQSKPSSNGGASTKAELYERAQKLDIEGRSKMTKAELERAIRDAG